MPKPQYVIARLMGFSKPGKVWHAHDDLGNRPLRMALCSAKPKGKYADGWVTSAEDEVTCRKCLQIMEKRGQI